MEVYFLSAVRPIRLVTPVMVAQGGGAIVNISTAWATEPTRMFPTSTAFRASLSVFIKIYSDDYASKGIRINNVMPDWIDSLPELEERRNNVPMARYGKSEEIAATIAFLLSEGTGYITGQSIRVDGGVIRSV
ncbi:MAG: SDR family oxidoreductase [Thiothrix sp.]|nr:SDR family oxidoreductase [Thiothrix sp.]HPE62231.1 SDR family oxidoreductase [Thiolinea sp.]